MVFKHIFFTKSQTLPSDRRRRTLDHYGSQARRHIQATRLVVALRLIYNGTSFATSRTNSAYLTCVQTSPWPGLNLLLGKFFCQTAADLTCKGKCTAVCIFQKFAAQTCGPVKQSVVLYLCHSGHVVLLDIFVQMFGCNLFHELEENFLASTKKEKKFAYESTRPFRWMRSVENFIETVYRKS